jgi:hypothetical protein
MHDTQESRDAWAMISEKLWDEKGILKPTAQKLKRRTPAEALAHRRMIGEQLLYDVHHRSGIIPDMDPDCRAIYWVEVVDGTTELRMVLTENPPLSARMRRAINERRRLRPERDRVPGVVHNNTLSAHREEAWHVLTIRRAGQVTQGLTFSRYMLLNAERYGFEFVEIQSADVKLGRKQHLMSVKDLLATPIRKAAGGYEEQHFLALPKSARWKI